MSNVMSPSFPSSPPSIHVLAGVDGSGKSSIGGAAIRAHGGEYFDPDEAARTLLATHPKLTPSEAHGQASQQGRRLLEQAIAQGLDYAFESTLGAHIMPGLLAEAARQGFAVHVWYAGLASPDDHVRRVRARVRRGGRGVDEADIRRRFVHSRLNLIELLPSLATLRLYDNGDEADPASGHAPRPALLLQVERGAVVGPESLSDTPDWARPIVAAALKHDRDRPARSRTNRTNRNTER